VGTCEEAKDDNTPPQAALKSGHVTEAAFDRIVDPQSGRLAASVLAIVTSSGTHSWRLVTRTASFGR
jgi:hypothetical protein